MEPGLFSASSLSRFPKLYKEVIDLKRRKAQKKKKKEVFYNFIQTKYFDSFFSGKEYYGLDKYGQF